MPAVHSRDLERKWQQLGLPFSVLEKHADCAHFLTESGLIFKIVGFRETCRNSAMHDVKLGHDDHPMIKVQGVFKRWELIKRELTFDSKTNQVRSLSCPGRTVQNWSYISPSGLVPIDRLNNDKVVSIYRLSDDECRRVAAHARKFYETNPEVDKGILKDWVIQFHTSPRRQLVPNCRLLDNLAKNLSTHIAMRLISPSGEVYSFGVEMTASSYQFLWGNGMEKLLGTATAKINKTGDFEEFRTHTGRFVTSIPLTGKRAKAIQDYLNSISDVRFNFLRQNCSNLMSIVLNMAGYDISTETTVKEILVDILPDAKHIPIIGPIADLAVRIFKRVFSCIRLAIPEPIQSVIGYTRDVVLFVPRKTVTLIVNLFIRYFGGTAMLHALSSKTQEDGFYKASRFLNFSRLIRSWTDLFKEQTQELYHPKFFIEWQKQQRSTFVEPGSSRPKLAIVPPY